MVLQHVMFKSNFWCLVYQLARCYKEIRIFKQSSNKKKKNVFLENLLKINRQSVDI